jgi:hypothetical protein
MTRKHQARLVEPNRFFAVKVNPDDGSSVLLPGSRIQLQDRTVPLPKRPQSETDTP